MARGPGKRVGQQRLAMVKRLRTIALALRDTVLECINVLEDIFQKSKL